VATSVSDGDEIPFEAGESIRDTVLVPGTTVLLPIAVGIVTERRFVADG
jgi:hypothetical protein